MAQKRTTRRKSVAKDPGIAIIGAGGHGKVVASALQAAGEKVGAFFDDTEDKWGTKVLGVTVQGPVATILVSQYRRAIVGIGSNQARRLLSESLEGLEWAVAVHPMAWVHESVELGPGTVVFAGAMVQPDTEIGSHVIVNTGATVDHDCRVGSFVHLAPGVSLAGDVLIDNGALLGIGSSVVPGVSVGAWATVGAGAAVVRDLEAKGTFVGVPTRRVREC